MERGEGVSDTYSGARGSSGAGFSIFARKTLRGGRINGDEAGGHTKGRRKAAFLGHCWDFRHDRSRAADLVRLRATFKGVEM